MGKDNATHHKTVLFRLSFLIKENKNKRLDGKRIYWLSRPNIRITVKNLLH